jgi:hypothetical protein
MLLRALIIFCSPLPHRSQACTSYSTVLRKVTRVPTGSHPGGRGLTPRMPMLANAPFLPGPARTPSLSLESISCMYCTIQEDYAYNLSSPVSHTPPPPSSLSCAIRSPDDVGVGRWWTVKSTQNSCCPVRARTCRSQGK